MAPGIRSVALPGHTPGHVGYEVVSGKQRLLDIGDMAHSSVLSLKKPSWTMGFDSDSGLAKATRRATLTQLAKDRSGCSHPTFRSRASATLPRGRRIPLGAGNTVVPTPSPTRGDPRAICAHGGDPGHAPRELDRRYRH